MACSKGNHTKTGGTNPQGNNTNGATRERYTYYTEVLIQISLIGSRILSSFSLEIFTEPEIKISSTGRESRMSNSTRG